MATTDSRDPKVLELIWKLATALGNANTQAQKFNRDLLQKAFDFLGNYQPNRFGS